MNLRALLLLSFAPIALAQTSPVAQTPTQPVQLPGVDGVTICIVNGQYQICPGAPVVLGAVTINGPFTVNNGSGAGLPLGTYPLQATTTANPNPALPNITVFGQYVPPPPVVSTPITFAVTAASVPGGQSTLNGSAVLYSVPIPPGTPLAAGAALRVTPPIPLPPPGGTSITPAPGLVPNATWLKTQLAVYTPFHWKAYVLQAATATAAGIVIVEIDNWGNGPGTLPAGEWTLWLN